MCELLLGKHSLCFSPSLCLLLPPYCDLSLSSSRGCVASQTCTCLHAHVCVHVWVEDSDEGVTSEDNKRLLI